jgi:hypothetical protein
MTMSNKNTVIIIVSIIILAFIIIAGLRFVSLEDNWICQNGQWIRHGNPSAPVPTAGCGESNENKNTDNLNISISNGDDASANESNDTGANQEANIIVAEPAANQSVGLPLTIKGKARVFENTVSFRIKDSDGTVLLENFTTADSQDIGQFGPFEASVNYPEAKGEKGTVEVFEYSAKDGSEINKVEIPVTFKKVESMNVKVFFGNRKEDPDIQNCSQVYEVSRRIPKAPSIARQALLELLAGPYAMEEDNGFFSGINQGVLLRKVTLSSGVATLDFSSDIKNGMEGSCEIDMIKAQINETLKQFPTIKEVKITIEGKDF